MTFEPGTYYVGDPGNVIKNDDLKNLFKKILRNELGVSLLPLLCSERFDAEIGDFVVDYYVCGLMQGKEGTLYDQHGQGWGFDWGAFGLVPWEWVDRKESYGANKVVFTEPVTCAFYQDKISIGHLHFTFEPK